MQAFQKRVIDEESMIDEKISNLKLFTAGTTCADLPQEERSRLDRQIMAMHGYSAILGERITAFKGRHLEQLDRKSPNHG